jgi:hypothetical protein
MNRHFASPVDGERLSMHASGGNRLLNARLATYCLINRQLISLNMRPNALIR